jgi:hypothetical protein
MRSLKRGKIKKVIVEIEDFIIGKWYIVLDDEGSNRILFQYSYYGINSYGAYLGYHIYDVKGSYFYESKKYDYEKGVPTIEFRSGISKIIIAPLREVKKYFNV